MNLTQVEHDILEKLHKELNSGNKIPLKELSKLCNVADSTITKLSKKLGYSGYVEMLYNQHNTYLREHNEFKLDLIDGDLQQTLEQLCLILKDNCNKKNIVIKMDDVSLIENYLVRKLGFFDIPVILTYDYLTVDTISKKPGVAFIIKDRFTHGHYDPNMIKHVIKKGYYIVVMTYDDSVYFHDYVDMFIKINNESFQNINFFNSKILALLEMMLSEYEKVTRDDE